MKLKFKPKAVVGSVIGILAAAFIVLLVLAGSWIMTCGIIKLITLCFGWEFSWGISTGIWLLMFLAKSVFSNQVTIKK